MREDRASCIHLTCSSSLSKVPPLNTPPHLSLEHPNFLSWRTVTKTRTDGHTSPLQIIMHLLIRLERSEDFLRRMINFLLASLVIKFLAALLTCYSLLQPPLLYPLKAFPLCRSWLLFYGPWKPSKDFIIVLYNEFVVISLGSAKTN